MREEEKTETENETKENDDDVIIRNRTTLTNTKLHCGFEERSDLRNPRQR